METDQNQEAFESICKNSTVKPLQPQYAHADDISQGSDSAVEDLAAAQ